MYRRFLLTVLSCYASLSVADISDWNCKKNQTGEWLCETETPIHKPVPAPPSQKPPATLPAKPPVVQKSVPAPAVIPPTPEKVEMSPVNPVAEPPKTVAETPLENRSTPPNTGVEGWQCIAQTASETWDCQLGHHTPSTVLTSVNSTNSVTTTENDLSHWSGLSPAFTAEQEQDFKQLRYRLPIDPWQQCNVAPTSPRLPLVDKSLRQSLPLSIESDYAEVFDQQISQFIGSVELQRADQHLSAQQLTYDKLSERVDTQGHVYYNDNSVAIFSRSANLQLNQDQAVLRDALFATLSGGFRGFAETAYQDNAEVSHYTNAAYTHCPPGNQDWVIHADRFKMNKASGLASATDAWLEFKGLPILYTPYINFPLDNRRTSGLLPPSWSSTARSGFQLSTPFYWNIAPNYDAIIRPRYLAKRGLLLGMDFRYLFPMTQGTIGLEYMPNDDLRNRGRFSGSFKNTANLFPNLTSDIDLNYVSDRDYLYELGNALSFADRRYLKSRAGINYAIDNIDFKAFFERYQTLDDTLPNDLRPYQKIPQINLDMNYSFQQLPIDLNLNNEFVYFYRTGRVSGQRLNTQPSISLPWYYGSAYIKPKLSLQYTQYILDNQPNELSKTYQRFLPITSIDSGLILETDLHFGKQQWTHTIEPRLFYLYIPYSNQQNMPIFDSALYDFNFNSLFRENRFSGSDRIQDANQLSLAITSRFIDDKGLQRLKLDIGQLIYFQDRRVTLAEQFSETARLSNFVTELSSQLNSEWSLSTAFQFNPHTQALARQQTWLQWMKQPQQVINIGY
ncbi:MAG: LPS-assembly protein LptD, partial [Pseudomonadota bacterium]